MFSSQNNLVAGSESKLWVRGELATSSDTANPQFDFASAAFETPYFSPMIVVGPAISTPPTPWHYHFTKPWQCHWVPKSSGATVILEDAIWTLYSSLPLSAELSPVLHHPASLSRSIPSLHPPWGRGEDTCTASLLQLFITSSCAEGRKPKGLHFFASTWLVAL